MAARFQRLKRFNGGKPYLSKAPALQVYSRRQPYLTSRHCRSRGGCRIQAAVLHFA